MEYLSCRQFRLRKTQASLSFLQVFLTYVGALYTAKVVVTIKGSSRSSTYSVNVIVNIGAICAVIAGGIVQFLRMVSSMTIDASNSYDDDQVGTQAGLLFRWSCQQLSPHFNVTCAGILFGFSAMNRSTLNVNTHPSAVAAVGHH